MWLIRIPRVIVGFFVEHPFAAAGVLLQSLFRNPLAEPTIVGVGEGAVLGGVIAFVTGWSARSVLSLPLMAMLFALIAMFIVYANVDPRWCPRGLRRHCFWQAWLPAP